jgi:Ribosomal protein L7/L12 C-terminal domain
MNNKLELPAPVIAEIEGRRKVSAIKLLRAELGIGLKEAKELVDTYIAQHPSHSTHQPSQSSGGFGRLFFAIAILGLGYSLYRHFG